MRRGADGRYWIPKHDPVVEAQMDKKYVRVPGELAWFPEIPPTKIQNIIDSFKGEPCMQIVGKGPSLDRLTWADLLEVPTICINQSIVKVEQIRLHSKTYMMQQDGPLGESCNCQAPILLCDGARGWYEWHPTRIIFTLEELGLTYGNITAIAAIQMARMAGITKIRMIAFDACVNGSTRYASVATLEKQNGEKAPGDRFLRHRQLIERAAVGMGLEWIIPK